MIMKTTKFAVFFIARVYVYVCILAALVACHHHEAIEEKQYAITLSSGTADAETRGGTNGLEQYAQQFFVYGYKTTPSGTQQVFGGEKVVWTQNTAHTTETNTCDWEYVIDGQTIKYWDFSSIEYRFFGTTTGKANQKDDSQVSWTFTDLDVTTESGVRNLPYFSELWYSNNQAPYPLFTTPVQLDFLQPYCMVRIKFVDEEGEQYENTKVLKAFTFAPTTDSEGTMITQGDWTVVYPTSGDQKEYTFVTDAKQTIPNITEPYETGHLVFATELEKWYTFLPPTPEQGTYTLKATLGRDEVEVTVPASKMQWKPGFQYTYIFKIPKDAGNIYLLEVEQAVIQNWDDQNVDHPVYNW